MTSTELSAVFRDHADAVFGFSYRMTGSHSTAEDVSQETFAALLNGSARFDVERGGMRAFLLGVARNLILKRWRAAGRWDPLDEEAAEGGQARPAGQETAVIVAQAVAALPPLQREALILAEYEGLALKEIARAVDAEVGTVKARLHRARENLRRALSPVARPQGASTK